MTFQNVRLKIASPALKLKTSFKLPTDVQAAEFITAVRNGLVFDIGVDYTLIGQQPISDPTTAMVVVLDETAGAYKLQSLSSLLASTAQIDQHITAAGPAAVANNAGIVRVDQTAGAAITLNMPLASAKTCPVLISDWKGDAGTNNITINLAGSDKFPGNLTSWTIAGDRGSVFLRPISGVGYVL